MIQQCYYWWCAVLYNSVIIGGVLYVTTVITGGALYETTVLLLEVCCMLQQFYYWWCIVCYNCYWWCVVCNNRVIIGGVLL